MRIGRTKRPNGGPFTTPLVVTVESQALDAEIVINVEPSALNEALWTAWERTKQIAPQVADEILSKPPEQLADQILYRSHAEFIDALSDKMIEGTVGQLTPEIGQEAAKEVAELAASEVARQLAATIS